MPKVRIHILNVEGEDKDMRIRKLEDKVSPPGRIEKAKRWIKALNNPIVLPVIK
jgi:hypothetical protein